MRWLTAAVRFVAAHPRLVAWSTVTVVVLVVVSAVAPVLELLAAAVALAGRALEPLMETPAGRLLLLNLVLAALLLWLFGLSRQRLAELRTGLTLARHLEGIRALCRDDRVRAREAFGAVARSRSRPPEEHPALQADARLKLARLALSDGDPAEAERQLHDLRTTELPTELRRSLAQLRLQAEFALGETMSDELERAVRAALDEFRDDPVLLGLLTDVLRREGRFAAAVDLGERLLERAEGRLARAERRQTLVRDLLAAAAVEEREGGARAAARAEQLLLRAVELAADDPTPGVALGDLLARRGQHLAALQAYGATASEQGLRAAADLLDRQPGCVSTRELLQALPFDDTTALAARELLRAGDLDGAARARRLAARSPESSRFAAELLAAVDAELGGSGVRALLPPPD